MKKAGSLLLCMVMMFTILIPTVVFGATEYTEGIYTYIVENGKATITDCDSSVSGSITIPSKLGGYSVATLKGTFANCNRLTSVIIPSSVKTIGNFAFAHCTNLTKVTIPNSVTSICDDAFLNCRSLTDITIPNSVRTIGERAFKYCNTLSQASISGTIGKEAFYKCPALKKVTISNAVSIGENAFTLCEKLTSVTIPNSVTSIGKSAFSSCYNLTNIIIPNSVKTIGERAFSDCDELTSITIPNSVTSIESSAFASCNNLTNITIPNSVTTIGEHVFGDCRSLTNITIPNSITSIKDNMFQFSGLKSITIPNSVTSIGKSAFANCNNLTSITLPDSVTSIGERAFEWCNSLTSITIPKGVKTIENCTFLTCENLTNVTIPDSVTSIGDSAFSTCRKLTSIIIPDSVTSIGNDAFALCFNLTNITIPKNIISIGDYAFPGIDIENITIPSSLVNIGERAFVWKSIKNITVEKNNPKYSSIDGHLFNKEKTTLIKYAGGKTNTSYTIPNSVTMIGDFAFEYCDNLKNITIPDSVTSIGKGAFSQCGLTEIFIPKTVTSIGNNAFGSCFSIKNFTVEKNNPKYSSVDGNLFNKNKTILIKHAPGKTDSSYIIPNGVTTIGSFSLFQSNLESISIPVTVTNIEYMGLPDWFSDLKDIYYAGSKNNWMQIIVGDENYVLDSVTIHYNSIIQTGTKGTTNSTSTSAPIIASVQSGSTDLFSTKKTVSKNSTEQITLKSTIEEETKTDTTELYLVQDAETKVKFSGDTLTVKPGQVFQANQPIYLMAVDTETGKSTARQTTLWVSSGTPKDETYQSKILNVDEVDGETMVNSVACNNSNKDVNASVYIAVYDKNGNFKGGGVRQTNLENQTDTAVDIALSCDIEPSDVIKTFFWENMMPLAEVDSTVMK